MLVTSIFLSASYSISIPEICTAEKLIPRPGSELQAETRVVAPLAAHAQHCPRREVYEIPDNRNGPLAAFGCKAHYSPPVLAVVEDDMFDYAGQLIHKRRLFFLPVDSCVEQAHGLGNSYADIAAYHQTQFNRRQLRRVWRLDIGVVKQAEALPPIKCYAAARGIAGFGGFYLDEQGTRETLQRGCSDSASAQRGVYGEMFDISKGAEIPCCKESGDGTARRRYVVETKGLVGRAHRLARTTLLRGKTTSCNCPGDRQ